jgi:hypothetical protein
MNTGAHDQASPADTSMSVTCRVNKPTVRGSLEKRAGRTVGCLRVATFTGRTQVRPGSQGFSVLQVGLRFCSIVAACLYSCSAAVSRLPYQGWRELGWAGQFGQQPTCHLLV